MTRPMDKEPTVEPIEPVEPKWDASDPSSSFRRYSEYLHERAKWVFLKDGTHVELVFAFKPNGERLLSLVSGDRVELVANLRELIRSSDLFGVVHIAEAWTRVGGKKDYVTQHIMLGETGVADLRPEDRGEALMVMMQSRDGQAANWCDPIVRDADGNRMRSSGFTHCLLRFRPHPCPEPPGSPP